MANIDNLWIDSDIYNVPILTCNVEDQDYPAIMSRFHYLLLKKDKKTYEEIVNHWAILIITALDSFDSDKLYQNQLFSSVYEKVDKYGFPKEKIELPPGQPKLEDEKNFGERIWKTNLPGGSTIDMDDLVVYRWYTDPANTMAARAFFGIYCMNLLRAFTKPPSSIVNHCKKIFMAYAVFSCGTKPERNISVGPGSATFLRNAFRSQDQTYRKVLRMVLDLSYFKPDSGVLSSDHGGRFVRYAVCTPLGYFGLDAAKLMVDHRERILNVDPALIRPAIKMAKRGKLTLTMKKVDSLISFAAKVNKQDESFMQENKQFKAESCVLWLYSRLISPDYFRSLANEENLEFLAFCIGLHSGKEESVVDSIRCLRKLTNRMEYYQLAQGLREEACKVWLTGKLLPESESE